MEETMTGAEGKVPTPREGDMAPLFRLPSLDHGEIGPEDFRGKKKVVIAFYPKDNTPG